MWGNVQSSSGPLIHILVISWLTSSSAASLDCFVLWLSGHCHFGHVNRSCWIIMYQTLCDSVCPRMNAEAFYWAVIVLLWYCRKKSWYWSASLSSSSCLVVRCSAFFSEFNRSPLSTSWFSIAAVRQHTSCFSTVYLLTTLDINDPASPRVSCIGDISSSVPIVWLLLFGLAWQKPQASMFRVLFRLSHQSAVAMARGSIFFCQCWLRLMHCVRLFFCLDVRCSVGIS